MGTDTNDNSSGMDLCDRPGVYPIQLQNATEWDNSGCNIGFSCKSNLKRVCKLGRNEESVKLCNSEANPA